MFSNKKGGYRRGGGLVSMLQVPVNERCVFVNFYLLVCNEVKITCLLSGVRTCYSKFRGPILMHFIYDMLMQPELTE